MTHLSHLGRRKTWAFGLAGVFGFLALSSFETRAHADPIVLSPTPRCVQFSAVCVAVNKQKAELQAVAGTLDRRLATKRISKEDADDLATQIRAAAATLDNEVDALNQHKIALGDVLASLRQSDENRQFIQDELRAMSSPKAVRFASVEKSSSSTVRSAAGASLTELARMARSPKTPFADALRAALRGHEYQWTARERAQATAFVKGVDRELQLAAKEADVVLQDERKMSNGRSERERQQIESAASALLAWKADTLSVLGASTRDQQARTALIRTMIDEPDSLKATLAGWRNAIANR